MTTHCNCNAVINTKHFATASLYWRKTPWNYQNSLLENPFFATRPNGDVQILELEQLQHFVYLIIGMIHHGLMALHTLVLNLFSMKIPN